MTAYTPMAARVNATVLSAISRLDAARCTNNEAATWSVIRIVPQSATPGSSSRTIPLKVRAKVAGSPWVRTTMLRSRSGTYCWYGR